MRVETDSWLMANRMPQNVRETRDSPTALSVEKVSTAFALFSFSDHREKLRLSKNNRRDPMCLCAPGFDSPRKPR
jgi:hypothetical protein